MTLQMYVTVCPTTAFNNRRSQAISGPSAMVIIGQNLPISRYSTINFSTVWQFVALSLCLRNGLFAAAIYDVQPSIIYDSAARAIKSHLVKRDLDA
jgi:hypothetical protein